MLRHAAAAALALAVQVNAHASMLMPAPRNAIDATLPGVDWGNGTNHTGVIEPLWVNCTNGTTACRPYAIAANSSLCLASTRKRYLPHRHAIDETADTEISTGLARDLHELVDAS